MCVRLSRFRCTLAPYKKCAKNCQLCSDIVYFNKDKVFPSPISMGKEGVGGVVERIPYEISAKLILFILEITIDLMKFIKSFLKEIPVFQSVPLYTIGESYGGKMIANFAVSLHEAVKSGDIECQLRGVGLGDSLISFPETVESYGPLYYSFSLLDRVGLEKINNLSKESAAEARKGNYNRSMEINDKGAELLAELTDNVDVYNILRHHAADQSNSMFSERQKVDRVYRQFVARLYEDPLSELMNGPIRKKLGIIPMNVTWGGQSRAVFEHQFGDLASAVLSDVSKLINYGLKVTIYEGQLDGICGTAGAEAWVRKLQWRGLVEFESSLRKPLYTPAGVKSKQTAAFVKSYQNVEFYYILKAGHMVPVDAPEMALEMLKRIIV